MKVLYLTDSSVKPSDRWLWNHRESEKRGQRVRR